MKTKFILAGIVALFVLSASAYAQPGRGTQPTTTKSGGKKGATSTKGTKKGTTSESGSGTTLPTSSKPTGTTTQPADDGRTVGTANVVKPNVLTGDPIKDIEAAAQPVIEDVANGSINYTEQYVESVGKSVIAPVGYVLANGKKIETDAQARLLAEQGAKADAQRNLLSIVKGVNVISETTVENMITSGDYIYTRVEGVVKGAKQVGMARVNNGTIEVTLRMPLYDSKNGVTAGFTPQALNNVRQRNGLTEDFTGAVQTGLDVIDGSKPLAFNIAGQKMDQSMFPVVVDENGKVLLDFSKVYEKTGKIPKLVQMGKDIMNTAGFTKGADFINLVEGKLKGTYTLADTTKKGKVNWAKIGDIAGKVGKVLLNILL